LVTEYWRMDKKVLLSGWLPYNLSASGTTCLIPMSKCNTSFNVVEYLYNVFLLAHISMFCINSNTLNAWLWWIKNGSSWIDQPQAKFGRSPGMLPVRTHKEETPFRLRAPVWCRPRTLGRESQYVEWYGGSVKWNYQCGGRNGLCRENCRCVGGMCVCSEN